MKTLERQLLEYGAFHEREQGSLSLDEVVTSQTAPAPSRSRFRRPWLIAAAAAAAVLVLIGGVGLLSRILSDQRDAPVVNQVEPEESSVVDREEPVPSPATTLSVEPSAPITGMEWQEVTPNGIDPIADVAPGLFSAGDRFVYVHGSVGGVSTSFDGINWTKQTIEGLPPDASNVAGWKDTMVWWGCDFGIDPGPTSSPNQGCVSVVRPDGTVATEVFDSNLTAVGVGPAGIVAASLNSLDEGGLIYLHEDDLVFSLTGRDITEFEVVEITDGLLHLESNTGQVSDYVLSDHGYTDIESQTASGWFSTDGEEWTAIPDFPQDKELQLIGTEDGFVAASGSTVWHSADGLSWRLLGPMPGDPWTLSRWNDGAVVFGGDNLWFVSGRGMEEMPLPLAGAGGVTASGGAGVVIVDIGAGEALDLRKILFSPTGEEWTDRELPQELSEIELTWGWFSSMAAVTDNTILLLLFEAGETQDDQSPVWWLGTPTTD